MRPLPPASWKRRCAYGTAAVVCPIGELTYQGKEYVINDFKTGPLAQKLYDTLTGIQWGTRPDPHGWTCPV